MKIHGVVATHRSSQNGLATVAFLALAISGCVSDADAPSPTEPHAFTTTTSLATTTTTITMEEGLANFGECLSQQGVTIEEIPLDGLGRPRMALALATVDLGDRDVLDALEACGRHLSSGALDLGADPELRDLVRASLSDFAACVRLSGVGDFPDPVPGFDGVGAPFPANRIPWTDPELSSAVDLCSARMGT